MDALQLLIGLAMLVGGAELFLGGSLRVGALLGLSTWATGATFIAFATSAPELAVNVTAAVDGYSALTFGNIVGSNIANVGLVVGVAAAYRPLRLPDSRLDVRIALLTIVAAAGLWGTARYEAKHAEVAGLEAGGLLLLFVLYLALIRGHPGREDPPPADGGMARSLGQAILGLALLTIGSELVVQAAIGLSEVLGLSQAVIGLSIVAVGTTLPELFTALAALRRATGELIVGAVVGSNVFNLLFVLAVTALVRPIPLPSRGSSDLLVMAGFALALLPQVSPGRSIGRTQGLLLLGAYGFYISTRATSP